MKQADLKPYIEQAMQGDKVAFRHLVDRMMPRLYAVVYGMVSNSDEVYDILQDVFVKSYKALPKLRNPDAFAGWMTRIAVNTTRTRLSRRREYPAEPNAPVFLQAKSEDRASQGLERQDAQKVLFSAMEQLSEEHREVVALVELQEMNCAEAAEILDCPAGTVRSRLHYARKKLKQLLAPHRNAFLQEDRHE